MQQMPEVFSQTADRETAETQTPLSGDLLGAEPIILTNVMAKISNNGAQTEVNKIVIALCISRESDRLAG